MNKPIVYVDMDGVLCDFFGPAKRALLENPEIKYPQATYGFFVGLPEKEGAVAAFHWLSEHYDTWILTRPSIKNPLCYTEKRVWVEQHLGYAACEKLIIAPDKTLLMGDYLIDDNPWPGFKGMQIAFGGPEFPNWEKTLGFFRVKKLEMEYPGCEFHRFSTKEMGLYEVEYIDVVKDGKAIKRIKVGW